MLLRLLKTYRVGPGVFDLLKDLRAVPFRPYLKPPVQREKKLSGIARNNSLPAQYPPIHVALSNPDALYLPAGSCLSLCTTGTVSWLPCHRSARPSQDVSPSSIAIIHRRF